MIKILKKDKYGELFVAEWKTGYIQFWEDWSQFLQPKRYNWLTFRPIYFEIDYDKLAGEHLGIEFGLFGFNLRFHQFIRDNKRGKQLKKTVDETKTTEEAHRQEVKRLKEQIKKLKAQLRGMTMR